MSTDLHTLSGAYAVNALSSEEALEFRRHLEVCQACRDEVAELQQAAATMGAAEAAPAPDHLRERVLSAAGLMPQLPPRVTVAEREPRVRHWWSPRMLLAAAAVLAVVAGGVVLAVVQRDDGQDQIASPAVAKVFEAPDAHTAKAVTANGGMLRVATSRRLHEMAVDTSRLKPLGDRQVYQVWSVHDGKAVSAAVLADLEKGAAMAMPAPGSQVAITIEPAGGSRTPTTTPIISVDPRSV